MNYKEELGRATWKFLHTFARGFDRIDPTTRTRLKKFVHLVKDLYPCEVCRVNLRQHLRQEDLNYTNGRNFRLSLCKLHNKVNAMLKKPIFDCRKIN
jgi:hypothetical protein